jgi:chemotaxis protein methyltransferase CheR
MSGLTSADFDYIRDLVRRESAIVLEPGKEYLVESRLTPVARQEGLVTIDQLVTALRRGSANGLQRRVVEAMTTNETSFFRDIYPFDALRTRVIPELVARRASERRLTIWSGACSSGQESYSTIIMLREHFPALSNWKVTIYATDLSHEMVERTRNGRFSQLEVNRGLPAPMLLKYFERHGMEWQVREEHRRLIEAQQMNLAASWPSLPSMDIVLMRNVLIYFDVKTKKEILARIRSVLRPDGYLFLGSAETTLNLDEAFERVQIEKAVCYRSQAR